MGTREGPQRSLRSAFQFLCALLTGRMPHVKSAPSHAANDTMCLSLDIAAVLARLANAAARLVLRTQARRKATLLSVAGSYPTGQQQCKECALRVQAACKEKEQPGASYHPPHFVLRLRRLGSYYARFFHSSPG